MISKDFKTLEACPFIINPTKRKNNVVTIKVLPNVQNNADKKTKGAYCENLDLINFGKSTVIYKNKTKNVGALKYLYKPVDASMPESPYGNTGRPVNT